MSFLFWGLAIAMLFAAIGFVAIPLKTGKPLFATPVALIALLIPLTAAGLYALLGSPEKVSTESAQSILEVPNTASSGNPQTARTLGSVGSMVAGLRTRLEDEPDDAGGWLLLARSYQHLDRITEAIDAYKRAQSLGKSDADLEAFLLGAGVSAQMAIVETGPALRGRVTLSAEAAALVQPGDTLFIFAKESPQHRMPVVALRKPATDLPIDFVLTENEMMVPGSHLSDFEQLVVTAKISRSGNAADDSQGLEAWSKPVSPSDAGHIDLLITPTSRAEGASNE